MTPPGLNLTLLLVTPDRQLVAEVESALRSDHGSRVIVQVAGDMRQGAEQARTRPPRIVLFEMTGDVHGMAAFAREVLATSPDTVVAGLCQSPALGDDGATSDALIELIRAGVKDFLRRPVSIGELRELLARVETGTPRTPARHGRILSFISNKGGVGKSTTAVNVACGLARRHPGRVLLVDASLQLGVCASMLDLQPAATITDAARQRDRLDATLLGELATPHSCGLMLLAAPRDAVEAGEVDDATVARVLTLARRRFDYVIVDTFPMFDRIVVAVLDMSDRAYIVLESVVPTLLGGSKLLKLLGGLSYPEDRQRIVLNRYANVTGGVRPEDVARRLGRTVDFVLPYDKRILTSANSGEPLVLRRTSWYGYSARVRRMVDEIEQWTMNGLATSNGQAPSSGEASHE